MKGGPVKMNRRHVAVCRVCGAVLPANKLFWHLRTHPQEAAAKAYGVTVKPR